MIQPLRPANRIHLVVPILAVFASAYLGSGCACAETSAASAPALTSWSPSAAVASGDTAVETARRTGQVTTASRSSGHKVDRKTERRDETYAQGSD